MALSRFKQPYFGLKGGWLTFWITVSGHNPPHELKNQNGMLTRLFSKVACATDMSLFGYDQGVFSKCLEISFHSQLLLTESQVASSSLMIISKSIISKATTRQT